MQTEIEEMLPPKLTKNLSNSMFSFLITLWQLKALEINKLNVKYKINLTIKKSDVDSHKIIIYLVNDYQ